MLCRQHHLTRDKTAPRETTTTTTGKIRVNLFHDGLEYTTLWECVKTKPNWFIDQRNADCQRKFRVLTGRDFDVIIIYRSRLHE